MVGQFLNVVGFQFRIGCPRHWSTQGLAWRNHMTPGDRPLCVIRAIARIGTESTVWSQNFSN